MVRKRRVKEEETFLDLTPLIDIIFQLIIFFVLTTAFAPFAIRVDLPKAQSSPLKEERSIMINITKDERIFWKNEEINMEELLRRVEINNKNIVYLIKGDKGVKYGKVVELLDKLKKKGIEKVGLVVEPES
ncbi:MAG: biopolymer transporter ExbD [Synergistetes bacterium]|nr:biopolymer transporter ExbD [Synergistota bacterium]MCX8128111.1 biopolymer transporter ExbD [Synergistota bacterium]MDW8192487.1 biopolymer transporter ExbD [Synergistota bacterium]